MPEHPDQRADVNGPRPYHTVAVIPNEDLRVEWAAEQLPKELSLRGVHGQLKVVAVRAEGENEGRHFIVVICRDRRDDGWTTGGGRDLNWVIIESLCDVFGRVCEPFVYDEPADVA